MNEQASLDSGHIVGSRANERQFVSCSRVIWSPGAMKFGRVGELKANGR